MITGGDSGIGRAVAIAFAREGADVLITHLEAEKEDADETARWVREAGRSVVTMATDLREEHNCQEVVERDVYAMFWLCKAAVPHMKPGSTVITTSSVQAFQPSPHLLDDATSKATIVNFTKGLGSNLADRGIRANSVAPGPGVTGGSPIT